MKTKSKGEGRPWGHFENIAEVCGSNLKIITVKPGQRLSLQAHKLRDEVWVVLEGTIIAETKYSLSSVSSPNLNLLQKGGQIKIYKGTLHRMSCYGKDPAVVLEVSFGDFDEEDIIRYEDDYGRPVIEEKI